MSRSTRGLLIVYNSVAQPFRVRGGPTIVCVWSQYDGDNIEQRTIGYGYLQNQEAKIKNCGRILHVSGLQMGLKSIALTSK